MRGSTFSAICALVLACCGAACNMVRDPEARMESGCGEGGRSALGVLDLRIGMPRAEALRILRCYDGDADLSFGTSGSYANDVSRFLREVNSGRSGYTNLVVWTRGRTRPCPAAASGGSSGLAETLRPDDERFSSYTISGVSARNWSSCFSEISNQIVLRLGGPPEQQVVVGVWHLAVPGDGRRVALEDMSSRLNARYPILRLDASANVANGFHGSAFADAQGGRLDHAQIERDYRNPAPPAAPQPPRTTEGCGFLLLSTCPRTPPPSEIDAYEAAMRAYDENSRSHQARMRMANAYGRCVLDPPRSPGEAAIDETSEAACGPSYYAAAFPYPGGLTEAYYIGVYDHRAAHAARTRLDEYVRSRRGERLPGNAAEGPRL